MNVLLSVHMFPPHHLAGGEMYMVNLAKVLISNGHHVRCYLHRYWGTKAEDQYVYEGIEVFPPISDSVKNELFNWCDIVITHLDFAKWSIWKAKGLGKPCIFVVHNTSHYYDDVINRNDNTYVIYNAEHARAYLQYKRPSMVMEPLLGDCIAPDMGRKYITLVNLCINKGVRRFYKIAERMPDHRFLGITGSYMRQDGTNLPNVTIWGKTPVKEIMSVTRVLLMPSNYESWGMVAAEALANGIPVICSPTPGLKENCSDAAIYNSFYNVTNYVPLLQSLDNPDTYNYWSSKGLERTKERPDRTGELINFIYRAYYECKSAFRR